MVEVSGEAPRSSSGGHAGTLRAAAAVPYTDRDRAVEQLRAQLRVMADAARAAPDWTTLIVTGPVEMAGAEAEARFEWMAEVVVIGQPEDRDSGERSEPLFW